MLISSTLILCPIDGFFPGPYESFPSNNCATILVSRWFGDGRLWPLSV